MIYTFYSFKGGVGRSMALANIAELFFLQGLKVLMVDFDLEAPGLELYFNVADARSRPSTIITKRGVIDMLLSYKELRSLPSLNLSQEKLNSIEKETATFHVEPLVNFCVSIYKNSTNGGELMLIPAGRRPENDLTQYVEKVQSFDWKDFYINCDGEKFFDWFRCEAEKIADVVLIDSRTGFTEMGGTCTHYLADAVLMFVGANQQNLDGTLKMVKSLSQPKLIKEGRKGRKLSLLPIPSRIENTEADSLNEFATQFNEQFSQFIDSKLRLESYLLFDLRIPYTPYYAYQERVAIRDLEQASAIDLGTSIKKLAHAIAHLAPEKSSLYRLYNNREDIFCNLPAKSYGNKLIGRKKEIQQLLKYISPNHSQHIVVLKGFGGVGKTALVVEVAYQCWDAKTRGSGDRIAPTFNTIINIPTFDAIIFTSSKDVNLVGTTFLKRPEKESTLLDIFRVISRTLDQPSITQVPEEEQPEQVRKSFKGKSVLLIVDNLETLELKERDKILRFLYDIPPPTKVIITTREDIGWANTISIESLSDAESLSLIQEQVKTKNINITEQQKTQIKNNFKGIPIAIIYAVGQLAGHKRSEKLNFNPSGSSRKLLPEDLGGFCFEGSVEPLRGTAAHKLLLAMTFFRESPLRDALIKVAGLSDGKQEVIDGLTKLIQLSLVTEQNGRYNILFMTREYAITELENHAPLGFKELAQRNWLNWYLQFTRLHGGLDWENLRASHDSLAAEWANIESVLYFCAAAKNWEQVMELWENIDNYVDLNGYWQKRRHWWALLEKNAEANMRTRAKALSEKAWTLILMGTEHHKEAEKCLKEAWDLCTQFDDRAVQADIANHLAILEKAKRCYSAAQKWLDKGEKSLSESLLPEKEKHRYLAQNIYYSAEIDCLQNNSQNNRNSAKNKFKKAIELAKKIKWTRLVNYAENSLSNILIEEGDLDKAEELIQKGLWVAESLKETRRIALWHYSYARLYYQYSFAIKDRNKNLNEQEERGKIMEYIYNARNYANRALEVFSKEFMNDELGEINDLLDLMENRSSKILEVLQNEA